MNMTEAVNIFFSVICTGAFLAALFVCVLIYSSRVLRTQGLSQGLYLSFIFIFQFVVVFLLLWVIPIPFAKFFPYTGTESIIRWLFVSTVILIFFYRRPHSDKRGFSTVIYHLVIIGLGWVINRWLGLFFFSLPLLGIFYYALYLISHVIIPASNPEDRVERHKRFLIFLSYVWGMQMPLWNVMTGDASNAEKRIDGRPISPLFPGRRPPTQPQGKSQKNKNAPKAGALFPGMIRTDSHQVVGILRGKDFRVEGPGVIFTDREDEPFEVVDLRTQMKKSTIRAFSLEGIPFFTEIIVAFRIDRDEWSLALYHQLGSTNPLLNRGKEVNHKEGLTFPYSKARVESAIRLRSKRSKPEGETDRWGDHVLAMAEQAAREILVTRSIKDLWQARENETGNASATIATNIKNLIEKPLRENGIQLLNVKTAGFKFTEKNEKDAKDDGVIEQQITTWSVERKRELEMALSDAKTKADSIEQGARINAQSVLLNAIMEGLEQARRHHPGKDQDAIAQVYLDAIKKMMEQQADLHYKSEAISEVRKARDQYFGDSKNSAPKK